MVLFMYPGEGPMLPLLAERGVPSHTLNPSRLFRILGPLVPALKLRQLNVDLLHVHHIPLFNAIWPSVRLAGIRSTVFTEHARFSISKSQRLQRACQKAARRAGRVTVVSEDLKRYFLEELQIDAMAIQVIHNGVDTRRFQPGERTKALSSLLPLGYSGPVLITVGRLSEAKDHSNLLAALQILKGRGETFYLILVGDGELRQAIALEIEKRGLTANVLLVGCRSDTEYILPGADAFVLSSKREGFPLVVLEAMAAGLPVVATSVGGVPEAICHELNGLLVPSEDPVALAEAIHRVCNDKPLAQNLARNARKSAEENFSLERVARAYSNIYLSLLERENASSF